MAGCIESPSAPKDLPSLTHAKGATELPWTEIHPTGWWCITIPRTPAEPAKYVAHRGFLQLLNSVHRIISNDS
jgi:hypothetical protein